MFSAFQKFGRLGASASAAPFSPTKLFAAGEAGGVWDFTTLANLYQDSTGTTPCTAVGDPIGLVLDTKNGTPQLGPELVTNGDFSDGATGWTVDGDDWVISTGAATKKTVGYANGYFYRIVNTTGKPTIRVDVTVSVNTTDSGLNLNYNGSSYTVSTIKTGIYSFTISGGANANLKIRNHTSSAGQLVITNISVREIPGNHLTQSTSTKRPVLGRMPATGVRNLLVNTATLSTQNVTTVAGSYTIQFTGAGSVTASGTYSGTLTNGQTFTCTAGTLTLTVSGSVTNAQLEAGSTATAYQKVGAAYDITESGVASVYTAYFDGVDDCLVSPSIDFSGTDKSTIWAGYSRRLNTAGRKGLVYAVADPNIAISSFGFSTPGDPNTAYLEIRGTQKSAQLFGAVADTYVATAEYDLAGGSYANNTKLRLNGSQISGDASANPTTGGGSFGAGPVTIGALPGEIGCFGGFLNAACTRGAATDAATVTSMEKWLAARTPGVTLP